EDGIRAFHVTGVQTCALPIFVFEFPGNGLPGYHIGYIDRPVRQCGSGEVVELAGDGWLEIRMEPAQAHDEQGRATVTERALAPESGRASCRDRVSTALGGQRG